MAACRGWVARSHDNGLTSLGAPRSKGLLRGEQRTSSAGARPAGSGSPGSQVEGARWKPRQGAACRRWWSNRASKGLWVLERRPRAAEERPRVGGSPQAVAQQACAGGGQGHFGECLGSCLGCQGAGHGVRLMWGDRWGFGVSRQNSTSWGRAKSKAGVPQRSEHKRQGQQGQGQERRAGAGQEVDCRCREDGHRTGRGPCFQGASSEKKPRPHRMGGWSASAARVDGRRTRGPGSLRGLFGQGTRKTEAGGWGWGAAAMGWSLARRNRQGCLEACGSVSAAGQFQMC